MCETNMDCNRTKELISDYSVGLVQGTKRTEMEAHLASCPDCSAELQKLERVVALVDNLNLREPPAGLWNGVYNRITATEQKPERTGLFEGLGSVFQRSRSRWSVGLATVMLVGVLIFSRAHGPATSTANFTPSEYIQGHIAYSSQDVLSDPVALSSTAALNDREQPDNNTL